MIPLPKGDDAFGFVIFGDRTGGPAEGIEVLEQAVEDTNLLDPDLVMTVGDLIQGYNRTEQWLVEMRQYRSVMERLNMPWFPVAGNHDVYYRGADRPPEEHEGSYETHFGPLWYSFEHKGCRFLVLYTDEANPDTGERNFEKPECQRMSPEQFAWLRQDLEAGRAARHVFVFVHHPRWLTDAYGDDWERVHRVLVGAGNVRAVFAGHIHRMHYDGERDGIEYFALATTGGSLSREIPEAGYLHHYNVVTVRGERVSLATIPVGAVLDPRQLTGEVSDDVAALDDALTLSQRGMVRLSLEGVADQLVEVEVHNPCPRPIALTVTPSSQDRRWQFEPDHRHPELQPDETITLAFRVMRAPAALDESFALPEWDLQCDYLGESVRIAMPDRSYPLTVAPPAFEVVGDDLGQVLRVGQDSCLSLAARHLDIPDGPLTVEGWLKARSFEGRRGFVAKTAGSEYGLFVSDGVPSFSIHLDGKYARAKADEPLLRAHVWHHVAGVFDGSEVRLYVDGRLVSSGEAHGKRTTNDHPLYLGADPDGRGQPKSFLEGWIDEVRITGAARYTGDGFIPARRLAREESTMLLLHMDECRGAWMLDSSGHGRHPERIGSAR